MLVGQYSSAVDTKGRVAVPKKLREQLGEKVIITRGYEQSLIIVSRDQWEELITGTGNKPFIVGSARDTNRFLFGSANEIELDLQGRFVIPRYLHQHAEIDKEAIFLGLGRYVEVWGVNRWNAYRKYLDKNIESIAKELSSLHDEK